MQAIFAKMQGQFEEFRHNICEGPQVAPKAQLAKHDVPVPSDNHADIPSKFQSASAPVGRKEASSTQFHLLHVCPQCGTNNQDGQWKCSRCGENLMIKAFEQAPPPPPLASTREPSYAKKVLVNDDDPFDKHDPWQYFRSDPTRKSYVDSQGQRHFRPKGQEMSQDGQQSKDTNLNSPPSNLRQNEPTNASGS